MTDDRLNFVNLFKNPERLRGVPAFDSFLDKSISTPFFNRWSWDFNGKTPINGIFLKASYKRWSGELLDVSPNLPLHKGNALYKMRPAYNDRFAKAVTPDSLAPTDNWIETHDSKTNLIVHFNFGKYMGMAYPIADLFDFFCKCRTAYLNGDKTGSVQVGKLEFTWKNRKRLETLMLVMLTSYYDWEISWTHKTSQLQSVRPA